MKPGAPVKVGGYLLESGQAGLWYLVDGGGRIRGTFWREGEGRWRGVAPDGWVLEEPIGDDVEAPHLVMARKLLRL